MEIKIISLGSEKQLAVLEALSSDSILNIKQKLNGVHPKLYPTRVSLKLSPTAQALRDDIRLSDLILDDGKLYFKDLGPQVGWTTVFLTEYAGPLIIYLIFYARPLIIYGAEAAVAEKNQFVKIAMVCHTFHYAKRLFETVFVHRFSKATMPIKNIIKNSCYYWGFAAWIAYFINHPLYTPTASSIFYPALGFFAFAELGNLSIHLALRALRPAGTNTRAIPQPSWNPYTWLFSLVSCPNYTYEVMAWISFSVMTSTLPAYFFTAAGFYQMAVWALGKHRNYKKEFSKYPRNRKAIIPFLL